MNKVCYDLVNMSFYFQLTSYENNSKKDSINKK